MNSPMPIKHYGYGVWGFPTHSTRRLIMLPAITCRCLLILLRMVSGVGKERHLNIRTGFRPAYLFYADQTVCSKTAGRQPVAGSQSKVFRKNNMPVDLSKIVVHHQICECRLCTFPLDRLGSGSWYIKAGYQ